MTSFNSSDRKINRILAKSQEYKTLLDEQSSQEDRRMALESLDAKRRQQPPSAYANSENGVNIRLDSSRKTIEQDTNERPTTQYGHQVFAGGYQKFSDVEATADPKLFLLGRIMGPTFRIRRSSIPQGIV